MFSQLSVVSCVCPSVTLYARTALCTDGGRAGFCLWSVVDAVWDFVHVSATISYLFWPLVRFCSALVVARAAVGLVS